MCLDHQNQFVHLHCHSEYSLLDGLSKIKDLVGRAAELKQPALALTDHGAMYGIMPFYRACKDKGIKPILGIETYLATRRMSDRDPQLDKERAHMLLLAQNQTGYTNLLEMATLSQLDGYYYKPRIDHHILAQFSAGVISTTGCLAAKIPQALMNGRMEEAHHLMGEYLDIFGKERFFIELQEHSIPELTDVNRKLIEMAPRYGLERNFLLTNDVHYTRADDADPHQVLLCIQTGSTIGNPKMTFSDKGYYLKSYEEMVQLFEGYDEQIVLNGLQNSVRIIDQCEVNLDSEGYHLPLYDVPAEHTPNSYLRFLCQRGLAWRYGANRAESDPALQQRLEHELNIIGRMGFETYFLIVWDLCEWAARTDEWWERYQDPFPYNSYSEWKRNDIWWNVRGSGAGSVVAYTLGITSIDPLANGLIFERFLNPGRVSMPDIDLDYPDDVRHWMVAYTKRKYGTDKVAQIITYGTLGARAAIRDVGRALDIPLPEVDSIAKLIAAVPGKPVKIENCFDSTHEFYSKELVEKYNNDNRVKRLVDTAKKLEGVTRHASSHAAGVIVSDQPLQKYVPLNRPTSGEEGLGGVDRVTQWPMEIVESIGLLKIDFLGLSTLTVMRRAARLIEERHGVVYTMDNIPYDEGHVGPDPKKDPKKLFDMLGRGDVAGVFQVEGAGMRRLMIDMKPRRFDHIIAAISLYRPGPMDNIPEYIKRMHSDIYQGKDIVQYHTPALTPILQDTYGILVYQEQIIRIASDLAGYEPGEADMIRKAVSKKKRDLIDKHKVQFTAGAMARGLTQEVCDAIWGDIEFFARYGFNKCLPGDTEVLDAQTGRLLKIEDLYTGRATIQQTISCDTNQLKLQPDGVSAVLDNGIKPVFRLTTALGKQIEATANHPFFTLEGWQLLGELQVGDFVGVPRTLPEMGITVWKDYKVITLAHLLAEGNLCHPHSVYYYTQKETSRNDYVQAIEQFDNVKAKIALHHSSFSIYAKRVNRDTPPGIMVWAENLGILGKKATEKEIPEELFTLKNNQIALFLGRLWDGDGSLIKQKEGFVHAYYATSSQKMAKQVQHLLLRLGIMSSFRTQFFNYKDGRIGYQIHVMGGEQMITFAQTVGNHLLQPEHLNICYELRELGLNNSSSKDVIPLTIKNLVRQEKEKSNLTWDDIRQITGVAPREFSPTNSSSKSGFRRETINRLANFFDSPQLKRVAESDLYWDKIVAVEYVGEKQTYDLTIAHTHNFIANDILVHNSHAADYAKVTCQTAFLKAHYPVEYLTAMLSVERNNADKVRFYFAEAKNLGLKVLPPDINRSQVDFTIEDEATYSGIRFGLGAIKNVGEAALNHIFEERAENGEYPSLQAFCERVDLRRVGKRPLEFMIKARVFERWGNPLQLLDALDRMVGESGRAHDVASSGQMGLFSMAASPKLAMNLINLGSDITPDQHKVILNDEKESLGVHVSEHPLERPLNQLKQFAKITTGQIDSTWNGKEVRVAGVITYLRYLTTKKGDHMAFSAVEDLEGKIDLVLFPKMWQENKEKVKMDQIVVVWGKVQADEENIAILVDKVRTFEELTKDNLTPAEEEPTPSWYQAIPTAPTLPDEEEEELPPMNPQPKLIKTPAAPPVQPVISQPTAVSASVLPAGLPPEPEWADEEWDELYLEPPTAVLEKPMAKPVNGNSNGSKPHIQEVAERYEAVAVPEVERPQGVKTVVVEFLPLGNWQDLCRTVLQLMIRFKGPDHILFTLANQNIQIEFPGHTTLYCAELTSQLNRIQGIVKVAVQNT